MSAPAPGERLFRRLLRLYPKTFRDRYGTGMVEFYRDRRLAVPDRPGARARLWLRLIADTLLSSVAEHLSSEPRPVAGGRRKDGTMETLLQDLRGAIRGLARAPSFTGVVLVTLALGIGANAAIFSALEAVLFRPLPYRHAERTMVLWNGGSVEGTYTAVAAPEYFDYKEQLETFDNVAALRPQSATILGAEGDPERLSAYTVTPNIFELLGTESALGRSFRTGDGIPGGELVVVLSDGLWRRRFGGDPAVIGRQVNVAGLPRTVIGIMPSGVRFPDAPLDWLREPADLWIPSTLEQLRGDERGNQNLAVLARRAEGVSQAQVDADLGMLSGRFRSQWPDRYGKGAAQNWRIVSFSLQDQMVGSVKLALFVISSAVGVVLLIVCVNVANLLLARGALKRRDVAVRMALGAGRPRLVRQMLTESLVLGLGGGGLGLLLAWVGTPLLVRLSGGNIPRLEGAGMSIEVIGFSFGVSLLTGIGVGLIPALQQSRTELRSAMGEGSRGASDGIDRRRFRSALVAAQVAMALVILVAAGLLGRSFAALLKVDPGFSPDGVLALKLAIPRAKYDSAVKVISFYRRLAEQVASLPGVESAATIYPLPMGGDGWSGSLDVEGAPENPAPHAEYNVTSPGYFKTMRIPLQAGREFGPDDAQGMPNVAIVDDHFARKYWPAESPLGKRINVRGGPNDWITIVGVVGHVYRAGRSEAGEPQLYLPHAQYVQTQMVLVARASNGNAAGLASAVRSGLKEIDPELPSTRMHAAAELADKTLAPQRFNALLIGIFALVALGLASVGLYGVMSYLVAQRTREIGIRLALGGQPGDVRRMVLRESLAISLSGLAVGGIVSLAVSRLLTGLLFGVSPTDAATYTGIAVLLLLVAGIASYGPARRATRVDPVTALRN
ncbi:MAG: ABC transporter permease [Gemmatimonadales bacterium]|nr:ABC transporter permease [Gemmatimonadales bacterium]